MSSPEDSKACRGGANVIHKESVVKKNRKSLIVLKLCPFFSLRRWLALGILAAAGASGCADPYSAKRINKRLNSQTVLARDIYRAEVRHARRTGEAIKTLDKWWRSDSARFAQRLPTVGDYVW
ncbi:MAG: hypothetical protein O7F76_03450 [Planctomycetota bacterium]|nr:hypothetical protein [Planctomycetota bacterium]